MPCVEPTSGVSPQGGAVIQGDRRRGEHGSTRRFQRLRHAAHRVRYATLDSVLCPKGSAPTPTCAFIGWFALARSGSCLHQPKRRSSSASPMLGLGLIRYASPCTTCHVPAATRGIAPQDGRLLAPDGVRVSRSGALAVWRRLAAHGLRRAPHAAARAMTSAFLLILALPRSPPGAAARAPALPPGVASRARVPLDADRSRGASRTASWRPAHAWRSPRRRPPSRGRSAVVRVGRRLVRRLAAERGAVRDSARSPCPGPSRAACRSPRAAVGRPSPLVR